jgi:hypothetical protein
VRKALRSGSTRRGRNYESGRLRCRAGRATRQEQGAGRAGSRIGSSSRAARRSVLPRLVGRVGRPSACGLRPESSAEALRALATQIPHSLRQSSKALRHSAMDSRLGRPPSSAGGLEMQPCSVAWHFGRQLGLRVGAEPAAPVSVVVVAEGAATGGAGAGSEVVGGSARGVGLAPGSEGSAGRGAGRSTSRGRGVGAGSSLRFVGWFSAEGSGGGKSRSVCSSLRASLQAPSVIARTRTVRFPERDIRVTTIHRALSAVAGEATTSFVKPSGRALGHDRDELSTKRALERQRSVPTVTARGGSACWWHKLACQCRGFPRKTRRFAPRVWHAACSGVLP